MIISGSDHSLTPDDEPAILDWSAEHGDVELDSDTLAEVEAAITRAHQRRLARSMPATSKPRRICAT